MSAEHSKIKLPKPFEELIKAADSRVVPEWQPFLTWYRSLPSAVREIADDYDILPYDTPTTFASLYKRVTITERVAGNLTGIYPPFDEVLERDPKEVKKQSDAEVREARSNSPSIIARLRSLLHRI